MNKLLPTMIRLAILGVWCLTTTAEAQVLASSAFRRQPQLLAEPSQPTVRALSDVLRDLERKYGIKFAFQRKTLQDKTVRLPLPVAADHETVLRTILKPHHLTYRKVDEQYYVILEADQETGRLSPSLTPAGLLQEPTARATGTPDDRAGETTPTLLLMHQAPEAVRQERRVSGRVTADESGEGLPGVSVTIKNTVRGTTTDASGNFALTIPNDGSSVLVFSFIGYMTQEVPVGNQSVVNLALKQSDQTLSEVVVVGYGTQRKADVTGSIASINTRTIRDQPVPNIVEGLTGRLPGVLIQQNTGAPGNSPSIKIRGLGSISAGNGPLVVIDGQPLNSGDLNNGGGLNLLNPNDIEKIDILKDASATAIYGSRGANGVVVVTTKRGRSGQARLNLDYYTGVQQITKKMDMLDAQQFAEFSKEAFNNAYLERVTGAKIDDPNSARPAGQRYRYPRGEFQGVSFDNPSALSTYDYQDMIFQNAPISSYQLTASGGSDRVQYLVSGNYLTQKGIVKRSGIDRYTVRTNIDAQVTSALRLGMSLSPSFTVEDRANTDGHWAGNGIINSALSLPPFIPIYQPNSTVYNSQAFYAAPYDWPGITNPVANIYEVDNRLRTTRLLGNAYAELKLPFDLMYRGTIGADVRQVRQNYYQTSALPLNQLLPPTANSAYAETAQELNWVTNHTLTYLKQLADVHRIEVLIGLESQKNDFERSRVDANNFPNDNVRTVNAGTIVGSNSARNVRDQWSLASYFGRVAYSFRDRYLVNASFRRDGSSRFGRNSRWGTFPSASVGWRVSEEPFMKNIKAISELKLKASYGLSGNNAFTSNYPAIGLLGLDNYVLGNNLSNGLAVNSIGNDDLTWEKSRQTDIGIELGVLNNRIFLTADYYKRITTDLLLAVQVPTLTGFSSAVRNIGKVENKGVELALNTRNLTGEFSWSTDLNFSFNRNKVLALGPTGDPIRSGTGVGETNITVIGQPLGSFYGYKQLGVFRDQADLDAYPHFADTRPGDVKYEDVNKDGRINADDRTLIGNNQPDFIYGMTNSFSFKGIDLGIVIQGVQGGSILNLSRRFYENLEGNANSLTTVLDRWRSPQQPGNGTTPRANTRTTGNNNAISSRWVENAGYFRIRNITVGYNLPKTLIQRVKLQSLRVYGGVQNALTISKYLGYNPEVSGYEGPLTGGVDYGSYPIARTYTIGINIGL
ncbi:SusC/RagA family TonB-linked outer membrane protein [Larkinella soli]|uniref:SusC/RagA family TonB-linked outer membrane protein n=1 Tax=Larkinella soli TaxID=1770527 RepID=UPI001E640B3B|nr:SusC/RagA family TonB-linked outer membrane protein [Larkinella soli]